MEVAARLEVALDLIEPQRVQVAALLRELGNVSAGVVGQLPTADGSPSVIDRQVRGLLTVSSLTLSFESPAVGGVLSFPRGTSAPELASRLGQVRGVQVT